MNHNFTIKETKYDESSLVLLNLKTEVWCQKSSIWVDTDKVKLPSECFSVWRSVLCLFSWASLICHCVSSGLSPSVLCLNQIFLFLFVFTTFSEEAACTYLETTLTPLAAWLIPYGLFIFWVLSKCWCFLLLCCSPAKELKSWFGCFVCAGIVY